MISLHYTIDTVKAQLQVGPSGSIIRQVLDKSERSLHHYQHEWPCSKEASFIEAFTRAAFAFARETFSGFFQRKRQW
jgi:hypothetical protein